MASIKILSELVANKIAAGEVIERPASVVKELIDNALDAGAAAVSATVRHGGKSAIRITDDGCGMDPQDARTCLIRHATSKIQDIDDIQNIATMGFRGEALPSIAAVSRLTITSRQASADTATVVQVAGGEITLCSEGVHEPGTTIEVADLFFNTPARRKFLKSDAAEYNAIAESFNTLALSRPGVSFTLLRGDLAAARYPACSNLLERIGQVYDPGFADQLYPLRFEQSDIRVHGYIGAPDNTRLNRTGQKFFINSRPVQSPALGSALNRAYESFLQPRRFPVAVLCLEIEPGHVDVNVHPAKREVRIRNERYFIDHLVRAVRAELRTCGFQFERPAVQVPGQDCVPLRAAEQTVPYARSGEPAPAWTVPASPLSPPAARAHEPYTPPLAAGPAGGQAKSFLPPGPGALPLGITEMLGQLHHRYILAETGDGLIMIDQHAAHERILFEELLETMQRSGPVSQQLLFPATLHLGAHEAPLLQEHLRHFESMGFGINDLGGGSFSVDALPACLSGADAAAVLNDTLHELLDHSAPRAFDSHREELAAVLACKTYAVKSGRALDPREQLHLVRKLGACDNPHTCPHGRPTFIRIGSAEIDKRFLRK